MNFVEECLHKKEEFVYMYMTTVWFLLKHVYIRDNFAGVYLFIKDEFLLKHVYIKE